MNMFFLANTEILSSYNLIIAASLVVIFSFFFSEIAKRTNVPSVLLLIILGVFMNYGLKSLGTEINFFRILELLGIVGLIMIVLEAALELKLDRDKMRPIANALFIALVGLLACAFVTAQILQINYPEMSAQQAWIYATPLSILSSAIIIPSVVGLRKDKKEFHIYESTFSDILGIMLFYFLTGNAADGVSGNSFFGFAGTTILTVIVSLVASYGIVLVFQKIKSSIKLFLLIAILLLLYSVGKKLHLSSLIIILIFGLLISNIKIFFPGKFLKYIDFKKIHLIYEELHVITLETAFVVRTFFFVIFGMSIDVESLLNINVLSISALIVILIYAMRYFLLRGTVGKDIIPQTYIAPRGLITILLFYAIPEAFQFEAFNTGILLAVIIITSITMTFALIYDKRRSMKAINHANAFPIGSEKWKARRLPSKN